MLYFIKGAKNTRGDSQEYYGAGQSYFLDGYKRVAGPGCIGGAACTYGKKPDPFWHDIQERFDGASITYIGTIKALDEVKSLKLAQLAAKRYEVEVGGCLVNGQPVSTDRDSQAKISGAFLAVNNGLSLPLMWKANGKFIALEAEAIKALALGVALHVQLAFANEAAHAEAINKKNDAKLIVEHDISTGWPDNPPPL